METYALKYFVAVAREENFHRAAERIGVSAPSLSKAVNRLESELGVRLFERVGRHVRLTEYGRFLKNRANAILNLEEATRSEIQGARGNLEVVLCGPEIFLSYLGRDLCQRIQRQIPQSRFHLDCRGEKEALNLVSQGDAQLALISTEISHGLESRPLVQVKFATCVGAKHVLAKSAKSGREIPIAEVLGHAFVSPSEPVLGRVSGPAFDGWRDDKFPRQIAYRASRVSLITEWVAAGMAVAYLPDYLVRQQGFHPLKITGCPYSCTQKVRLVAKRPHESGWLNDLFSSTRSR